jgi:rSAM/selenodomain-associated transferase 1
VGRHEHLIVFAREPRMGAVKSRLAKGIGVVAATIWYRRQLRDLLRRLKGVAWRRRYLFVTPPTARHARIWPRGWIVMRQTKGDLGARMRHALSAPGPGPAVLVGSDIPGIRARHLDAAFRALAGNDMVLGPAADGGYWLIGMRRRRAPPPFGPVRWSSEHALADTIAGFPKGSTVALIETLNDVDDVGDLV